MTRLRGYGIDSKGFMAATGRLVSFRAREPRFGCCTKPVHRYSGFSRSPSPKFMCGIKKVDTFEHEESSKCLAPPS